MTDKTLTKILIKEHFNAIDQMVKARYRLEGFSPAVIRLFTGSTEIYYDLLKRRLDPKEKRNYSI